MLLRLCVPTVADLCCTNDEVGCNLSGGPALQDAIALLLLNLQHIRNHTTQERTKFAGRSPEQALKRAAHRAAILALHSKQQL